MVDRDRILARLDEVEGYLRELRAVSFETVRTRLGDFEALRGEVLAFLRS